MGDAAEGSRWERRRGEEDVCLRQCYSRYSHVPSCDPHTRRRPSPRGGDAVEEAREEEEEDQPMTTEAEVGPWG